MKFTIDDYQLIEKRTQVLTAKINTSGQFLAIGDKSKYFFGLDKSELTERNITEFLLEEEIASFQSAIKQASEQEESMILEFQLIGKANNLHPMRCEIFENDGVVYMRCLDVRHTNLNNHSITDISKISKIGPWYHDPINDITIWSKECYKIFDLDSSTEITPDLFLEFYNEDDHKVLLKHIELIYSEKKPYEYIGHVTTKNNIKKWVKTIAEPVIFNGVVVFVKGYNLDITKEHNLIKSLRQVSRRQQLALKGIRSGLFHHDLVTDLLTYGPNFKKMIGINGNKSRLLANELWTRVYKEDLELARTRHKEQLALPTDHYFNHYRLVHEDGKIEHYEIYAWKDRDRHGQLTEMVGNMINVEKRVTAEKDVELYLGRLETIIDNAFLYTLLLDVDRTILNADKKSVQYILEEFGVDNEQPRGRASRNSID